MKVTYNWLKDFVDISLKPKELADKLTMAGLEVVSLEEFEGDHVFEIEITSNRPDWLSVIGIAREVAAITGKKLKPTADSRQLTADPRSLHIKIESKKACPFYSARVISDVRIGPSPEWMAKRLRAIGLRPVNNIVDITNYVLWTTGQPLHSFDLDKLVSHQPSAISHQLKIIVRKAINGEEITTIDGLKRVLNENILIIAADCDEKNGNRQLETGRAVAIAGIMGGKESEVSEATRNILIESAYFYPLIFRKAARFLALSSDS